MSKYLVNHNFYNTNVFSDVDESIFLAFIQIFKDLFHGWKKLWERMSSEFKVPDATIFLIFI